MLEQLQEVQTFEEMRVITSAMIDTLPGYFLKKNLSVLKALLEHDADKNSYYSTTNALICNNK